MVDVEAVAVHLWVQAWRVGGGEERGDWFRGRCGFAKESYCGCGIVEDENDDTEIRDVSGGDGGSSDA